PAPRRSADHGGRRARARRQHERDRARRAQQLAAGLRARRIGVPPRRRQLRPHRLAPHRPRRHRKRPDHPADALTMRLHRFALLACCLLFAACGDDQPQAPRTQAGEDVLPKPATTASSVTGMPDPGVANPQPAPILVPDQVELPDPVDLEIVPPADTANDAQQAVDALRAYYAAIDAGDHAGAYARW